ncbi:MAG TPA: hypothetical protein VG265_13395 [Gaiellaceae bacterium]|jgi:hypothetical protein|nr:hypothetical protein [Gaiellaceae bacterium]
MRRGGDRRGNSTDRRNRKLWLLAQFGDGQSCACAHCGTELEYETVEADRDRARRNLRALERAAGLPVLQREPLKPTRLAAAAHRGDRCLKGDAMTSTKDGPHCEIVKRLPSCVAYWQVGPPRLIWDGELGCMVVKADRIYRYAELTGYLGAGAEEAARHGRNGSDVVAPVRPS